MMKLPAVSGRCAEWMIGVVCAVALPGCQYAPTASGEDSRWIDLFDGQSLTGWSQVNGEAPYRIVDGVIRGTNVLDSPNSFLATNEAYSDFVLEFESRSIGDANSGVQFRTERAPGTWSGVVGYQLDIDPTARRWTGGIYHEGVHVWRHAMARNPDCQAAYQHGEWNSYRIEATGSVIATWVNGAPCAHMVGHHHASGFVALQVHAIGQETQYLGSFTEWRRLRILNNPDSSDLRLTQRAASIEGWLENEVSETEIEKGWRLLDFSNESAAFASGSDDFEFVVDMRLDDEAEGLLEYTFGVPGATCTGLYQILNDVTLGEGRAGSTLMGSYPDKYAAENLSEPGRPKRAYSSERWNRVRILVTEDEVQHWLNSVKVVEYPRCETTAGPSEETHVSLSLTTQNGQIESRNAKVRISEN